ncbi:MAG TPA: VOC family protein [Stellaceae bacterium]|nr:VOC family protein [Stellaceae bacterium]
MIRGIHHVGLNTADIDRLVAFYRDVMGFEVISSGDWSKSELIDGVVGLKDSAARHAMLRAGNCYLEIFQYSSPEARDATPLRPCDRGYTHFCLDVTDIDEEHERLTRAGMRFFRKPGDFGELRAVYGKDPDGNVVEIQEVLDPQAASAPSHLRALG